MKRLAAAACAALVAAGCTNPIKSMQQRPVEYRAALKEVGLPLYPGAHPFGKVNAVRVHMDMVISSKHIPVDTLTVISDTKDPFAEVVAWYGAKLPSSTQKMMNFHLGSVGMAQYQLRSGDSSRQVQIIGSASDTQIQLIASSVPVGAFASAAPSANPTGR
jgi:hypothetical protein